MDFVHVQVQCTANDACHIPSNKKKKRRLINHSRRIQSNDGSRMDQGRKKAGSGDVGL